jgi:hypothetical protein
MENWKDIKDFEGLYLVSNHGKVKRVARIIDRKRNGKLNYKEKELSQHLDKYGYKCVSLQKDGKRYSKLVHRLVMIAFSNEQPKPTVNHKDGIKINNYFSNLEWASIIENIEHAIRNGLRGDKTKTVYKYKDGVLKETYNSIKEAAFENNISKTSIIHYIQGNRNSKKGYKYTTIKE